LSLHSQGSSQSLPQVSPTWQGRKVLVTGAGGFIGSHLTEFLVSKGATVRAMVHYNALGAWGWLDSSPLKDQIEVVAGDICDRDSVSRAVKDQDVVFHLAALIAIPYSYQAPASYIHTNIEGSMNVLVAAQQHGIERVIHTSTSEVYGTARYAPIDEGHPLQGQSPYSASKIGADKIVESFHLSFGVPAVTVRPFNTFGPRQSTRAVIPTIITQLLTGNHVKLGSLHPTRDLNYVGNTVEGFVLAAEAPDAVGQTVNIGSGREISIGDLVQVIAKIIGVDPVVESDDNRVRPGKSEVERLIADNTLAHGLLGWQPRLTLEEGLAKTVEWMREHLAKFRPGVYSV
jgi:dTDP-glucose 4,6-dehydratase